MAFEELKKVEEEIKSEFEAIEKKLEGVENESTDLPNKQEAGDVAGQDVSENEETPSPSVATDISAQADASNLSLDHKLDLTIATVPPVQTELQLLLENRIRDVNTPNYQDEVVALMDLQEATKKMPPSSQSIIAKSIKFNFADKG